MEVVMLENYFARPSTIDRIRAHWLAPQIERYVEWMQTNGYADRKIVSRVPYLCQFADFTERRGTTDLNSAAAQVEDAFAAVPQGQHEQPGPPVLARLV
jgi:integrase/recombinase XerD